MTGDGLCRIARIEALKEVETYCYRIAFFLLEREDEAVCAVREAIMELCEEEDFFREPEEARLRRAKAVVTVKSLERKQIQWLEALLEKKNA